MWRNDKPFKLLVRIIGQRENDPVGMRARFERADLDAPDNAVGAGRGSRPTDGHPERHSVQQLS